MKNEIDVVQHSHSALEPTWSSPCSESMNVVKRRYRRFEVSHAAQMSAESRPKRPRPGAVVQHGAPAESRRGRCCGVSAPPLAPSRWLGEFGTTAEPATSLSQRP